MNDDVVARVDKVWKRYGLPLVHAIREKARCLRSRRIAERQTGEGDEGSWVLRDVSLDVRRGETVGIIGRNGAGKSTLLKVLAGVTPPTRGSVEVPMRVFPMVELNAGLHMELTGRENAQLLGAVMGMSHREIRRKMSSIEDFCELGAWFDRPVRTYSSGMLARLGFGVAVSVDADLLLVDEVLAVGDLEFQKKCYRSFEDLRKGGVATLFVSHNLRQVERICDKVLYLEDGRLAKIGTPEEICLQYYRTNSGVDLRSAKALFARLSARERSGELEIEGISIVDELGRIVHTLKTLDPMRIRVTFDAKERVVNPVIGLNVVTSDMIKLLGFGTGHKHDATLCLQGRGFFDVLIPELRLLPGMYSIGIVVKSQNSRKIYVGDNLAQFCVESSGASQNAFGMVYVDAQWNFGKWKETGRQNE